MARTMSAIVFFAVIFGTGTVANANPILWTFGDLSTDGSPIVGSFVFDADLDLFSDVNIATGGGPNLPGAIFSQVLDPPSSATLLNFFSPGTPSYVLEIGLNTALTNSGGDLFASDIGFGGEWECATNARCNAPGDAFGPLGGADTSTPLLSGVAIPEPATFAMFGLGLAGLGWSRRKSS